MHDKDKQELMKKWQVLGLSLMLLSQTNEEFFDLVKQEFGYVQDGKGWIEEVSYQQPITQCARDLYNIQTAKSPASEGKYDTSGASTFLATGDHFWIAVVPDCKKNANSLD